MKDRIKKPSATAAFFNQYDNNNENKEIEVLVENNDDTYVKNDIYVNVDGKNNNEVVSDNKNENNYDNNTKIVNKNENNINESIPSLKLSEDPKEDEEREITVEEDDDYLRNLVQGKKPKKNRPKKVFTSFYMDPDLSAVIDKMMKNAEKGDKSKLINTAIRKLLKEYGAIK